ncbi:MAG: amidophosphoribosyltransferase [Candidatus Omnitrophica bacterium]|nr:amidophosphoribosyltransferase [Candidatus Omnitrophota bacterium]
MCGIFGIYPHKEASKIAYLGLYALQHRGEEAAGIISRNGHKTYLHKSQGLVSEIFDDRALKSLRGEMALGHVRYSTTGSSSIKNTQPFYVRSKGQDIAIAHNGNLINARQLRNNLEESGALFQTSMDSEVIVHLLAHSLKNDYKEAIIWSLEQLQGAYSLAMMFNDVLVGARDTHGFRPLCLGRLGESYILASETCALDLIGAKYLREVEPGEVVFIYKDQLESIRPFTNTPSAFCIFEYIYFARPDSNIFGHNVYEVRKKLGEQLAKEFKQEADMVMPIPDSGTCAALGFAQASNITFENAMIRNHYIGRTFIQPSQFLRDFRVRVKLNPVAEILKNKNVVVIEDSIVRGTTSRARVKTLRQSGAKKVNMCVSCPPLRHPCFYGIDFPTKKELIASKHTVDWIRDFIGADSLGYLSLEGMLSAMPVTGENFCTACFSGDYPVKPHKIPAKNMFEKTTRIKNHG